MDVLILRDPRESAKKCSLTPLRGAAGVRFLSWRVDRRFAVGRRVLLHPEGEEITAADAGKPLLLVDCAWRRLPTLLASVDGELEPRRLPALATAYPRKSKLFEDPERGLASIEALYAALALLGDPRPEMLASYRWADEFLALNPGLPRR
jgi:pre-rRNA-processing protein TSR3